MLAGNSPIAIASYNDDLAIALLSAARDLDIAVPAAAAIVGADHTVQGQFWKSALTTIDTDFTALVEENLSENLREQLGLPRRRDLARPRFRVIHGETA